MKILISMTLLMALLSACSPDSDGQSKIAGSQRQALQKAKGVEATVQKSAEEDRKKVDEQTE